MSYKARIRFDNREWLVVDNIEYEGVRYFYIIEDISNELNDLENIQDYQENLSIEFIYKLDNGNYTNVTNQELITKLSSIIAIRAMNSKDN